MRAIKVLESTILHGSDQIFWLDGQSAESISRMSRIGGRIQTEVTEKPLDLTIREGAGKTVLWRQTTDSFVSERPDTPEKTFTSAGTYTFAGIAYDPKAQFLPRALSLTAGNVPPAGHPIVLYPAPVAIRFNSAGGLRLTLARDSDDSPLAWAIAEVSVTVPGIGTQTYRGQADQHGDLLLPFLRLPPLPEGVSHYSANISITGRMDTSGEIPVDPNTFGALDIGEPDSTSFNQTIGFSVVPGDISTLRSDGRNFLALKPV
ncbi:hypothetical protein [Thalassolituus maritimus]|uniref:Uncharacterized protein n=1 Tax=Thalassolituus maritimus TaxID=484498 RepID=A0ABP9ZZS5_9GAMM